MSKEVNNNRINISKELTRKQIFDCAAVFILLAIVYFFVNCLDFSGASLVAILIFVFLFTIAFFEYTKNYVKDPLETVVLSTFEQTINDINSIQTKNKSQKENNNISDYKIKNIKELVLNLQECSNNMNNLTNITKEKTEQSLSFTNSEHDAVKTNIEKMFSIRHKIQTIAELILELSDFVQSISSTIGLVEDIAEQTNLLALNAAVEAARAGEHGKGFAVVASEIRKLADESKQATTKIISLIHDIQQTANSTVLATEEGTKEIESGLELAHIISENIEHLINAMVEISANMKEIIASSQKINNDSKITDDFVKEISQIVENNQQITKENETIFEKIETTSNTLRQSVI